MKRVVTKKRITVTVSYGIIGRLNAISRKSGKSISELVDAAIRRYYVDPLQEAIDERQKCINRIHELNPYIDQLEKSISDKKVGGDNNAE